jgi:hypothetical protein
LCLSIIILANCIVDGARGVEPARPLPSPQVWGEGRTPHFSKQYSALFGRCERSEHKRPVRTVTVVAVALTATENCVSRRMRASHSAYSAFIRNKAHNPHLSLRTPSPFIMGEGKAGLPDLVHCPMGFFGSATLHSE